MFPIGFAGIFVYTNRDVSSQVSDITRGRWGGENTAMRHLRGLLGPQSLMRPPVRGIADDQPMSI